MLGNILANHLSLSVIEIYEKNNVDFVLLHPSSTHLSQPLYVALFTPLKQEWRKILEIFKKTTFGRLRKTLPNDSFPALLGESFSLPLEWIYKL